MLNSAVPLETEHYSRGHLCDVQRATHLLSPTLQNTLPLASWSPLHQHPVKPSSTQATRKPRRTVYPLTLRPGQDAVESHPNSHVHTQMSLKHIRYRPVTAMFISHQNKPTQTKLRVELELYTSSPSRLLKRSNMTAKCSHVLQH